MDATVRNPMEDRCHLGIMRHHHQMLSLKKTNPVSPHAAKVLDAEHPHSPAPSLSSKRPEAETKRKRVRKRKIPAQLHHGDESLVSLRRVAFGPRSVTKSRHCCSSGRLLVASKRCARLHRKTPSTVLRISSSIWLFLHANATEMSFILRTMLEESIQRTFVPYLSKAELWGVVLVGLVQSAVKETHRPGYYIKLF